MHYVKIAIAVIIIASIASASLYGRHHALRARALEADLALAKESVAIANERIKFYEEDHQRKITALATVVERSVEASREHARRMEALLGAAKKDPVLWDFLRQPLPDDLVCALSVRPRPAACAPAE